MNIYLQGFIDYRFIIIVQLKLAVTVRVIHIARTQVNIKN